MQDLIALVAAAAAFALASCSCQQCRDIYSSPQWPSAYLVSGVISLPYAEISEPFFAYYDTTIGNSRVDYYGGTVKTYQFSKMGPYGTSIKLVPVTTESQTNVITCLRREGTDKDRVTLQSVLPSLDQFTCAGEDIIDGQNAQKWVLTSKEGEKVNEYTMWITWRKSYSENHDITEPVPVRYEIKGYNTLLASHYDQYYLTYDNYRSDAPPAEIWEVNDDMTCRIIFGTGPKSVTTFNPIREFIHNYDGHIEHAWLGFLERHSRNYSTDFEHHNRRRIFRDNHRFVHSMNRAGLGYELKLNHFADRTTEEMKALQGRTLSFGDNGATPFPYSASVVQKLSKTFVPEHYDWRQHGAVTPVKDQATCGGCWSFSATGVVEGAYFLKTGTLVNLSEQALIDCSWGYGNYGCDGGWELFAYEWIMKHGGIPLTSDYGQYLGQDGYCHIDHVSPVAPITGYVNVTANDEDALRLAIFTHGPISIAINADVKTFSFYANGVYSDSKCKNSPGDLNHSLLAVGYGELNGEKFWIVKNSWSNHWGDDGYILIATKNNICGVMTSPTYVTM